ncbi:MAG TPA: guanylate cyclase, partial [Actinomycetota bacterium]|nr:guanylate cyclase [Actinomycetota bacterium]
YAYLLKDRVAEGDQLIRAIRAVATGGSMLDPSIVDSLVRPVTDQSELTPAGAASRGTAALSTEDEHAPPGN